MKTLLLIGIGAGDPEHITVQGINALNRANVLFVLDKGQATEDLVRMRLQICQRYIREPGYRVVQVNDPQRDSSTACYTDGVEDWHQQRAEVFTHLIEDQLADGECADLGAGERFGHGGWRYRLCCGWHSRLCRE